MLKKKQEKKDALKQKLHKFKFQGMRVYYAIFVKGNCGKENTRGKLNELT